MAAIRNGCPTDAILFSHAICFLLFLLQKYSKVVKIHDETTDIYNSTCKKIGCLTDETPADFSAFGQKNVEKLKKTPLRYSLEDAPEYTTENF